MSSQKTGGGGGSSSSSSQSMKRKHHDKDEDRDALVILRAIADYKASHDGKHPTPTTMAPFLDSIKESLLQKDLTPKELYTKFRNLRKQYQKAVNSGDPGPTQFHRTLFDLSVKAWGEKKEKTSAAETQVEGDGNSKQKKKQQKPRGVVGKNANAAEKEKSNDDDDDDEEEAQEAEQAEEENEEAVQDIDEAFASICETYKHFTRVMREIWEENGHSLSTLKVELINMDKRKAKILEKKLEKHYAEGWEIDSKRLKVYCEVTDAFAARMGR